METITMADVNSTTPLGTENAGVSTTDENPVTVLSFHAGAGDGFFCYTPTTFGYWRTNFMSEWRPIPHKGLAISGLPCGAAGLFELYIQRAGANNVTDIRAGRIRVSR
jgi:hypothetical protein